VLETRDGPHFELVGAVSVVRVGSCGPVAAAAAAGGGHPQHWQLQQQPLWSSFSAVVG